MAATDTWLSILPAVPLARGVPVVHLVDGTRHTVVEVDRAGNAFVDRAGRIAYALRWLARRRPADQLAVWIFAWVRGETTEADRIALAKAIREVIP